LRRVSIGRGRRVRGKQIGVSAADAGKGKEDNRGEQDEDRKREQAAFGAGCSA
jgi:hypothetical protein